MTAPDGSFTVPLTEPVYNCAQIAAGIPKATMTSEKNFLSADADCGDHFRSLMRPPPAWADEGSRLRVTVPVFAWPLSAYGNTWHPPRSVYPGQPPSRTNLLDSME